MVQPTLHTGYGRSSWTNERNLWNSIEVLDPDRNFPVCNHVQTVACRWRQRCRRQSPRRKLNWPRLPVTTKWYSTKLSLSSTIAPIVTLASGNNRKTSLYICDDIFWRHLFIAGKWNVLDVPIACLVEQIGRWRFPGRDRRAMPKRWQSQKHSIRCGRNPSRGRPT